MGDRVSIVLAAVALSMGSFANAENLQFDGSGLDVPTIHEFNLLDRDRGGSLDGWEFSFSEICSRYHNAGHRRSVSLVFQRIDRDGNGTIELPELVQSQQNRNVRILNRDSSRGLIKSDGNLNGLIERDEFVKTGSQSEVERFASMDTNGSGSIGPIEWIRSQDEDSNRFSLSSGQLSDFAALDLNDDGAVTENEFESGNLPTILRGKFTKIDLNGNREVGPGEYAKAISQVDDESGISDDTIDAFEEIDRNRDKAISQREFLKYSKFPRKGKFPRGGKGEFMFERMDDDGNGEVSLSEYSNFFRWGEKGKGKAKGKGKGKGKKGPKK